MSTVREKIGFNRFFETAVFPTNGEPAFGGEWCGCMEVSDWSEIEMLPANTTGEARRNHEKMVKKYAAIAEKEEAN